MALNHKQMSAHIRKRLQIAGIKARVDKYESCGQAWIRVYVPAPNAQFSNDEQFQIKLIADANRLTRARGEAIDMFRMTDPQSFHFEFHSDAYEKNA